MNRSLTDPIAPKPTDVEAHAVLDDEGNPWPNPLDPTPPPASWTDSLRGKLGEAGTAVRHTFDKVTAALDEHSFLAMGVALGAGYVVGRLLAARADS
jgi:hypothetical protein